MAVLGLLLASQQFARAQNNNIVLINKFYHIKNQFPKLSFYKDVLCYHVTADNDSAAYYAEKGLEHFKKEHYPVGEAWMTCILSYADEAHGQPERASKRLQYALSIFKDKNEAEGIAYVYNCLGILEAHDHNYKEAENYFNQTLSEYAEEKDYTGMAQAYMNLGIVNVRMSEEAGANVYFRNADSVSNLAAPSGSLMNIYADIAAFQASVQRETLALQYLEKGINRSRSQEFIDRHIEYLTDMGVLSYETGRQQEGNRLMNEALNDAVTNKMPDQEVDILVNMALLVKETDKPAALRYLENALSISKGLHKTALEVEIDDMIAAIYRQQKDFKSAVNTEENKQMLLDSITYAKRDAFIHEQPLESQTGKVHELQMLNTRITQQRNSTIIVAVCCLALLITLSYYYRKSLQMNRELVMEKQSLSEMNSMKDRLFSIIGHDLRGAVSVMPGLLEIYETEKTKKVRKYIIDQLKIQSNATSETLNKLLTWGQSIWKGVKYAPVNFLTRQYIQDNINLMKSIATQKKITVRDRTEENIKVHADPAHFDFVIRNLISNAIKFTREGGTVSVNADEYKMPDFVVFEVKDNGVGISKDVIKKIFEPLSTSTRGTANEKGTGIGLMLCKEFVTQNGGSIWVESKEGEGSTFYFSVKKAVQD
jgi:signal transduction histidine kinase